VATCKTCGAENPESARLCSSCGTPLAGQEEGRRQRKTVTVVFCDVVGSTALGETADPEAVETILARYFARMKEIVEAHGGTVEKFIGDAPRRMSRLGIRGRQHASRPRTQLKSISSRRRRSTRRPPCRSSSG
jgi:hypothetical protein